MAISVVMPALELTQESGKLIAWRKKEGERVGKGEVLLEVETDKAVVEIEAPADGILAGIEAAEGAVVPVGQTIAWIVQAGEAVPARGSQVAAAARQSVEAARASAVAAGSVGSADSVSASGSSSSAVKISPKARRLAKERGVDIDAKEAVLFALLAYESECGRPGNLPSATGARMAVPLGKRC